MLDYGNGSLIIYDRLPLLSIFLAPSDEGAGKNLRFLTEGEKN